MKTVFTNFAVYSYDKHLCSERYIICSDKCKDCPMSCCEKLPGDNASHLCGRAKCCPPEMLPFLHLKLVTKVSTIFHSFLYQQYNQIISVCEIFFCLKKTLAGSLRTKSL